MTVKLTRRAVTAGLSASIAMPWIARSFAFSGKPIVLGVPAAQTSAAGVADHLDFVQGTTLAMEEINAAGGILGRELKLFTVDIDVLSPESSKQAIAACVDANVDAVSFAFTLVPIPAIDASAKYKCPLLYGNAQRAGAEAVKKNPGKYSHVFQTAPSEVNYGWTFHSGWSTRRSAEFGSRRTGRFTSSRSRSLIAKRFPRRRRTRSRAKENSRSLGSPTSNIRFKIGLQSFGR